MWIPGAVCDYNNGAHRTRQYNLTSLILAIERGQENAGLGSHRVKINILGTRDVRHGQGAVTLTPVGVYCDGVFTHRNILNVKCK